MLTVYDVKQGDSMLLTGMSGRTCCFDDEPLLIDCGLKKANVHARIGRSPQRLRVLVTHADRDHIGGLAGVLTNHQVTRLYIPRFLPEIQRIESYLRKRSLSAHTSVLAASGAARRIEVCEGDRLCSHTLVMNPPRTSRELFHRLGAEQISPSDLQGAVSALRSAGLALDDHEIINYSPEPINDPGNVAQRHSRSRERKLFFQGFFIYLARSLQNNGRDLYPASTDERTSTEESDDESEHIERRSDFQDTGNPRNNTIISTAFRLASNQASIVFRYDGLTSFLFTGDADCATLQRITDAKLPMSAKYLKVPHHGSRHNLNSPILMAVNPKFAIVSHGNKRFGSDPDGHPHIKTMNLLTLLGIDTHYTNDVIKGGKVVASATTGKTSCGYLFFK